MEQSESWIGERVWFLTTMHFTRRDDVKVPRSDTRVKPQTENAWEPDYLVYINTPGRDERRLGLFLFGRKSALTEADANRFFNLQVGRRFRDRKFSYPVGLLYFSMATDEGFYSWLAEPTIREGFPGLHPQRDARSFKLDRDALDRIINSVNVWYDAFYATIKV